MATTKAEETGLRILEAALELFRNDGFDSATMRSIAQKAGVATGAAYYYYPSKEAIVMDFYVRSSAEMVMKALSSGSRRSIRARAASVSSSAPIERPRRAAIAASREPSSNASFTGPTIRNAPGSWRVERDDGLE